MSSCPDADTLVSIGNAVEWRVHEVVAHLAECPECRGQLDRLGELQLVLNGRKPLPRAFTDDVMRMFPARRVTTPVPVVTAIARIITPALAAATVFFVLALASAGPAPIEMGTPTVVVSIGAALAVAMKRGSAHSAP